MLLFKVDDENAVRNKRICTSQTIPQKQLKMLYIHNMWCFYIIQELSVIYNEQCVFDVHLEMLFLECNC